MRGRILFHYGVALQVLFVVFCMLCDSLSAETFIVKDGQSNAEIIIPEKPTRSLKLAATELQTYIEKISGAKLPVSNIVNSAVPVKIYVGKSKYTDELKLSDEGLTCGAFKMVSGDNWLAFLGQDKDFKELPTYIKAKDGHPFYYEEWDALTGGKWGNIMLAWPGARYSPAANISDLDERGSLNAVYEYLRGLGIRWYMTGDLGEVVPTSKDIALKKIDKTVRPDFEYRDLGTYAPNFASGSRDAILWRLRNGLGRNPDLMGLTGLAHGLIEVHTRDKSHPERFALFNGKRAVTEPYGWGTPCLSSEGFITDTVAFCRAFFRIYPNEPIVDIMPGDSLGAMCQCELCRGKGSPERGFDGMVSDYVWGFVNRVATELYKTNPDKKVFCEAYGPYTLPPEKIDKFSPNVLIRLSQFRMEFYDPAIHSKMLDLRKAYMKKLVPGSRFCIADYYLSSRPEREFAGIPAYFPHIIAEDLRSLKGKSLGEFIELTYGEKDMHAPGFNHLNVYVTGRYYWDADQDLDALLGEYYEKFYGPAAKEMKAFIEYSETNWHFMQSKVECIDKAFELLAAARKTAGETVYGKRIALLVDFVQPMKALREKISVGRKGAPEALAAERKDAGLKLDGRLDDAFWKDVPVYELKDVVKGTIPVDKTEFQIAWCDRDIIFGIRCEDADMKKIVVGTRENEDSNLWNGDVVEVYLDTPIHSYYQIAINPAGIIVDLDRRDGKLNSIWSSEAKVAAYAGDTFWSVEIRIPTGDNDMGGIDPLKKVEGRKPTEAAPWYFNVCRQRYRDGKEVEDTAFSPTGKMAFPVPEKFGKLIVK